MWTAGAAVLAGCSGDDRAARQAAAGPRPSFERLMQVASPAAGARLFGQCAACHTVARGGENRAGPNLDGVVGRSVAGNESYGYTYALRSVGGRWDERRLDAWLTNPARFAPGTSMTFAGLSDPLDRADVIAFLRTQGLAGR